MNEDDLYYDTLEEHTLEILRECVIESLKANNMVKRPSGTWHKRPPPRRELKFN